MESGQTSWDKCHQILISVSDRGNSGRARSASKLAISCVFVKERSNVLLSFCPSSQLLGWRPSLVGGDQRPSLLAWRYRYQVGWRPSLLGWRPSLLGWTSLVGWRPSPLGWRRFLLGWRPLLVGWRPSLVGWRPSLVGWRASLVGWRPWLEGWRPSLVVGGHRQ